MSYAGARKESTMSFRLFVAILVVGMGTVTIQELACCFGEEVSINKIKEPELAAELRKRFESDQAVRNKVIDFYKEHNNLDDDLAKLDHPPIAEKWAHSGERDRG